MTPAATFIDEAKALGAIRPGDIPPQVRIAVTAEDLGAEGLDYFGEGLSEQLFDTPAAVARIWRSSAPSREITLDAGAVRAVVERRASLLPAGITAVAGSFVAGDPVDLAGPDGAVVARGLVNFDAAELPALLGRSTHDLKRELGAAYEREVVHRDDLVVL